MTLNLPCTGLGIIKLLPPALQQETISNSDKRHKNEVMIAGLNDRLV